LNVRRIARQIARLLRACPTGQLSFLDKPDSPYIQKRSKLWRPSKSTLTLKISFTCVPLKLIVFSALSCWGFAGSLMAQQLIPPPVPPGLHSPGMHSSAIPNAVPNAMPYVVPMIESAVPIAPVLVEPQIAELPSRPSRRSGIVAGTIVIENTPEQASDRLPATAVSQKVEPAVQPTIQSKKIADEINSIRKQLGGGLSSHFELMTGADPKLQQSLEESFQNEIGRLANQQARQPELKINRTDLGVGSPLDRNEDQPVIGNTSPIETSVGSSASCLKSSPPRVDLNQAAVDQLRSAASKLDQMAGQFETSGLYEEADQIRAQAQKLWHKSRHYRANQNKPHTAQWLQPDLSQTPSHVRFD